MLALVLAVLPASTTQAKGGVLFTYRVSGGDLPYPITVSLVEAVNAQSAFTSADSEYEQTGLGPPDTSATRYRVESVNAGDPQDVPGSVKSLYVLGTPSRISSPVPNQPDSWAVPAAAVRAVLDRYIVLGREGALPPNPTFGQAVAAASAHLPTHVRLGGRALTEDKARQMLAILQGVAPVEFGVRGKLIGQRDVGGTELSIAFGSGSMTFRYVQPGIVAPFGLLMDTARTNNWQYTTLLDPPGYAQIAYTLPAEFDALMADLGLPGTATAGIASTRVVPLLEAQQHNVGDVARVVVHGKDGQQKEISPTLFEGICRCGGPSPVEPFAGDPLIVEEQYEGAEPFPEAVRPASYLYYPGDASGSGRGVLVQTQVAAVLNGTLGSIDAPFYVSSDLDQVLREITASPPSAVQTRRSSRRAFATAAASALAMGVLLAAGSVAASRAKRSSLSTHH